MLDVSCAMKTRHSGLLHVFPKALNVQNQTRLALVARRPTLKVLQLYEINLDVLLFFLCLRARVCVCVGTLDETPADEKTTSRKQGNRKI